MSIDPTDLAGDPIADEEWIIEVDHDSYYAWQPIAEEDVQPGDVVIDSYWPGFKMKRIRVDEPTTTRTTVNVPSLQRINDDRTAAGVAPRSHISNLIRHLEDGPWAAHFPVETITAIRSSHTATGESLAAHFVGSTE
jgi:hypothetical protein